MGAVESQMVATLADSVSRAVRAMEKFDLAELTTAKDEGDVPLDNPFVKWMKEFPLQALLLALNIRWTKQCEAALVPAEASAPGPAQEKAQGNANPLEASALKTCVSLLGFLADKVVQDVGPLVRHRIVHIITEVVHQRDVCR